MTIQVTAEIPQDATRDDEGLSRNIERAFRIQRKELAAAGVSGRLAQDTLAVVTALLSQNQRLCAQAELDRGVWQNSLDGYKKILRGYCKLGRTVQSTTDSLSSAIGLVEQTCQRLSGKVDTYQLYVTRWERAKAFCEVEIARRRELESGKKDRVLNTARRIEAFCGGGGGEATDQAVTSSTGRFSQQQ